MPEQTNQVPTAPRIQPLGLRLGAVLLLLFSIFGLMNAFTGMFVWREHALLITFYIVDSILSLLELTLVWALWSLRPWAFWATVSIESICIAFALFTSAIWRLPPSLLTSLVFPIAIILCLFVDPNVRSLFHFIKIQSTTK